MFSQALEPTFRRTVAAASLFGSIPVDYDPKTHRMTPTASKTKARFSDLQRYIMYCSEIYTVVSLAYLKYTGSEDYHSFLPLVIFWCIVTICTGALFNFQNHKSDWIWLFNQVHEFNGRFQNIVIKETFKEKQMASWTQGHAMISIFLIAMFFVNPTHALYMYSILPEQMQNAATFSFFLVMELVVIACFFSKNQTEFYTQAWIIKSLIVWHKNISVVPTNSRDFIQKVRLYNGMRIITRQFTICFGTYIEVIKTVMQIGCVSYLFFLVVHHDKMDYIIVGLTLANLPFTMQVPPFLYGDSYEIYDVSLQLKQRYQLSLSGISELDRKYCQRLLVSMRPNRIILNGLYFLDSMMILTYIHIVLNVTISSILMARP